MSAEVNYAQRKASNPSHTQEPHSRFSHDCHQRCAIRIAETSRMLPRQTWGAFPDQTLIPGHAFASELHQLCRLSARVAPVRQGETAYPVYSLHPLLSLPSIRCANRPNADLPKKKNAIPHTRPTPRRHPSDNPWSSSFEALECMWCGVNSSAVTVERTKEVVALSHGSDNARRCRGGCRVRPCVQSACGAGIAAISPFLFPLLEWSVAQNLRGVAS